MPCEVAGYSRELGRYHTPSRARTMKRMIEGWLIWRTMTVVLVKAMYMTTACCMAAAYTRMSLADTDSKLNVVAIKRSLIALLNSRQICLNRVDQQPKLEFSRLAAKGHVPPRTPQYFPRSLVVSQRHRSLHKPSPPVVTASTSKPLPHV